MDYSSVVPKLFQLQTLISRKTDLARRIANIEAHERSSQLELELKRLVHRIGGPSARFNEEGTLSYISEQRERDAPVKAEYQEVCKQVKALEEEIEQQLAAAVA